MRRLSGIFTCTLPLVAIGYVCASLKLAAWISRTPTARIQEKCCLGECAPVTPRKDSHKDGPHICETRLRSENETEPECWLHRRSKINWMNVCPFANVHSGRTAILLCPGPSLRLYKHSDLDEAGNKIILFGVNAMIVQDIVKKYGLDYLFVQDAGRHIQNAPDIINLHQYPELYREFTPRMRKWYGTYQKGTQIGPNDSQLQEGNATQYEVAYPDCGNRFPLVYDVGWYVFGGSCTVALSAFQFILFTGVSKLRIVGCDVTTNNYAHMENRFNRSSFTFPEEVDHLMRESWEQAARFLKIYYPTTIVEVVNPIGLRGMFHEIVLN